MSDKNTIQYDTIQQMITTRVVRSYQEGQGRVRVHNLMHLPSDQT